MRTREAIRHFFKRPLAVIGLIIVLAVIFVALFAKQLAPYDPTKADFLAILQPPNAEHLLGTDEIGRDLLSRIIYGARASLQAGIVAVLIAVGIGVPIGLLSGYFRGWVDEWIVMRVADAMIAFPTIVLALALSAVLGGGLLTAMMAIGIANAPIFMRLARGQALSIREHEFVEAARAVGSKNFTIMMKHVLPNMVGPILVQTSIAVAGAILAETALSFLGLGVQPPTPSWGSMLRIGTTYMEQAIWLSIWPGLAIFITVLGINLLGDGLRDVLDPKDR